MTGIGMRDTCASPRRRGPFREQPIPGFLLIPLPPAAAGKEEK